MFFHFFFFKHIVTIGLKLYFLLLPFPDMYVHVIVRKTSNKKGGVVVREVRWYRQVRQSNKVLKTLGLGGL